MPATPPLVAIREEMTHRAKLRTCPEEAGEPDRQFPGNHPDPPGSGADRQEFQEIRPHRMRF